MRRLIILTLLLLSFGCGAQVRHEETVFAREANISTPTPTPVWMANASIGKPQDWVPSDVREILSNADSIELFSIYFTGTAVNPLQLTAVPAMKRKLENESEDRFYGSEILGKVVINNAKAKREILDTLFNATSNVSSIGVMMCFKPRHGIEASYQGKTVKLSICFECGKFYAYSSNKQTSGVIKKEAQPFFDAILKAENVPLADEELIRRSAKQ